MADIAAEAGISVSSIYDYYPSKEDLAYEIPIRRLAEFYAEFQSQALPRATMRERLHLFLSMASDYARRNPDWARLLYLEIWPSVLIEEARLGEVLFLFHGSLLNPQPLRLEDGSHLRGFLVATRVRHAELVDEE